MPEQVKIVECPRDAMQGIHDFIPTDLKINYLNALMAVGYDTLDFGSFVSPKAIPQLADTEKVLAELDLESSATELLAIVANLRGAQTATQYREIKYLGYPFSISETFQIRNTQKTIAESLDLVKEMQDLVSRTKQELVIYISMGFGNPYGDPWSPDIAEEWVSEMASLGIRTLSLADTVGTASPETIAPLFETLIPRFPHIEFGAHFHAAPQDRLAKLEAAWQAGCRRFDTALKGFGGCPFAEDELVGNIATETLLDFLHANGVSDGLNKKAFAEAMSLSSEVFGKYH